MNAISTINLEKEQHNDASNVIAPPTKEKKAAERFRKEKEKRKERESNRALPCQFTNTDKISGKIDSCNNWAVEDSVSELASVKRIRRENE